MALLKTGLPVVQQEMKTWGVSILAGPIRKPQICIPVRKCLHSRDCFFNSLVGGVRLAIFVLLYFV